MMLEQVARALLQCAIDNRSVYREGAFAWRDFEEDARKVVAAMRLPTEAMKTAGSAIHGREGYGTSELDAGSVWERMIDAAVAEGP